MLGLLLATTLSLGASAQIAPEPALPLLLEERGEDGTEPGTTGEEAAGAGEDRSSLSILGARVEPGTRQRLLLRVTESFVGALVETPVLVAAGSEPGSSLCVVAGIHGDEINGVEIVRQMMLALDETSLRGNVIAVPIANIAAFRRGSRYLPDRRDLNRFFPGRPFGSSASRIAHALFTQVIERCDALVDLHTGSFLRTNLHQLRADLDDEATAALALEYGAEIIVHHQGGSGTLRRAATDAGIPAVTVEAGQPSRFDRNEVEKALRGLDRILVARGMRANAVPTPTDPSPVIYRRTSWIRSDQGGILVSRVGLGDRVVPGAILGTISDPLSGQIESIQAPHAGRVIGMAFDQLVMPGFAAYHIGVEPGPLGTPPPSSTTDRVVPDPPLTTDEEADPFELDERPE